MNQIQTCWKFEGNFYYKSIGIKVLYLYVVIVDSLWFTEKIILKDKSNKNLLWSMLRRDPFWLVRKNQTSKEFGRHDDSIPYLDNAKLILFRTTQNGSRLSWNKFKLKIWNVLAQIVELNRSSDVIWNWNGTTFWWSVREKVLLLVYKMILVKNDHFIFETSLIIVNPSVIRRGKI